MEAQSLVSGHVGDVLQNGVHESAAARWIPAKADSILLQQLQSFRFQIGSCKHGRLIVHLTLNGGFK